MVGAAVMARAGRPASESYQPVCYSGNQSISFSSEAGSVGQEDDDDRAPIFSLSKSSMDVVMATGPPHKRDPAWIRTDLRRSSSTNTPTEQTPQSSVTLKQLHPHMLHHINATSNSQQVALTAQNMEVHSPPGLTDRWIANMQRWSECSTQSRSSTPDTIVWKDGTSRPSSLSQEAPYSPISKLASSPTTPSPLVSPLQTPSLLSEDLLTSSSLQTLSTNQQKDFLTSSPAPSPLRTPLQPDTSPALPSNSPNLPHPTSAEDEGFLENSLLTFIFPSPVPSSVSLGEGAPSISPGCLADGVIEELHASPGGPQLLEGGGATVPSAEPSPVQMLSYLTPNSPAKGQESEAYLELPGQSCPTSRRWRSPMVYSVSDSQLGECCKCHLNTREGITKAPKTEEGTMTSQPDLVDAAVQTTSPIGSLWGLRRNVSTTNMGSHSILGSPPGSRLNLKASVGSNSNLVSPSSSMFPVSSEEEDRQGDEQTWDSPSSHDLDKRRSCLKRGEEGDEMGRRSSMKQVQWDEDGMTWEVHGASVDPEVLSSAIQKHLELQNSPQPAKRPSKKKKAPKPPLLSNVVKAMTPEINPPVTIITSTCMVEGESKETPDKEREVEKEEEGESKKEEPVEAVRRLSRAEADNAKEDSEVYGEEGASHPKSPSQVSTHSRKKSVIRALRRPRWCGGSKKADD